EDVAVPPAGEATSGVVGHHLAVGRDALPVKGRLDEPALAKPELAFGEEQAVARQLPQEQTHPGTLDEVAVLRDEHVFDGIRMVDEESTARADANRHEVAVVPGAPGIEAELIAPELATAAEQKVASRPSGKRRERHAPFLTPPGRGAAGRHQSSRYA